MYVEAQKATADIGYNRYTYTLLIQGVQGNNFFHFLTFFQINYSYSASEGIKEANMIKNVRITFFFM